MIKQKKWCCKNVEWENECDFYSQDRIDMSIFILVSLTASTHHTRWSFESPVFLPSRLILRSSEVMRASMCESTGKIQSSAEIVSSIHVISSKILLLDALSFSRSRSLPNEIILISIESCSHIPLVSMRHHLI